MFKRSKPLEDIFAPQFAMGKVKFVSRVVDRACLFADLATNMEQARQSVAVEPCLMVFAYLYSVLENEHFEVDLVPDFGWQFKEGG